MVAVVVAALAFFWWIIFIVAWIIFLTMTMALARAKGHSPLLWGLLACFFPVISIIVLLLLPTRSR